MINENLDNEETQAEEPEVKRSAGDEFTRVAAILFVFAVYFLIFLKIMFLS